MSATDRADSHRSVDPQCAGAVGSTSPQAITLSPPNDGSPADLLDPGQVVGDNHKLTAGVEPLATDQVPSDTHSRFVGGDPSTPGHGCTETHISRAEGDSQPLVQGIREPHFAVDGWLELRIWCEQLEDAMAARIAAVNRAERGGVDPVIYEQYIAALTNAEHVCELAMRRCYRRVAPPEIVAWQKSERGIGDKLTARLLGHLGDPCIATPHHWEGTGTNRVLVADEPFQRTVSQLWQYCGVGDPTRRKTKGMTADEAFALGNPTIKMLLHLHAECCVKAGSGTYRDIYDDAREQYADRVHATDCVRCGPSGKPALVGSPWSKGHQHAAALRKVAKEILRDLWRVRHAALCPPATQHAIPRVLSLAGELDPSTTEAATTNEAPSAGDLERRAS